MTKLRRPAIDARRDQREHRVKLGVPVPLDDLRAELRRRQTELLADPLLDPWIEMRVRAHGSAQFSHPNARLHLLESFQRPAKFVVHQRQLQPEGDRLRMDAVAAPDHRRVEPRSVQKANSYQ